MNTQHIACPSCNATNRVPADKNLGDAQCGRCHKALFEPKPVEVEISAFDATSKRLYPQARFVKVNTEEQQALSARYGIRSIPTLAIFRGGKEVARQAGSMSEVDMTRWIQSAISK
jgi:thioredoxin 2